MSSKADSDQPDGVSPGTQFHGSFADVERDMLVALRKEPSSVALLVGLGKLHLEGGGNYTTSLEYFRRAEAAGELSVELFLDIGRVCNALRQYGEAERYLRLCIEIEPRCLPATSQLAFALCAQQEYTEAVHLFNAVAIELETPQAHFNCGSALLAAGRPEEAIDAYQRAIWSRGDLPDFHFGLSSAYEAVNRPDDAINSLRRGLELDPSNERARHNLGRLMASVGQFGGLGKSSRRRNRPK